MNNQAPSFLASEQSEQLKEYLYIRAFWVAAADGQLRSGEQRWLIAQFGEDSKEQLHRCLRLGDDAAELLLSESANKLTPEEKAFIEPRLREWLQLCAAADGEVSGEELEAITKLLSTTQPLPPNQ